MISRDGAYQALADRLQSALPSWNVQRTVFDYSAASAKFPTCTVLVQSERPSVRANMPVIWELEAEVTLVIRQTDTSAGATPVDKLLNSYVDLVIAALQLQPGEQNLCEDVSTTLGGKVYRTLISGAIDFIQGIPGNIAAVIIPVTMTAA